MNWRALLLVGALVGPSAMAGGEVKYFLPFQYGDVWGVTCGNDTGGHANPANRFAFDFGLWEGTPVCAAAAGEVVSVVEGFDGPTGDQSKNNQVAIRHADGRVSVYLHVKKDGVVVDQGDKVERGDLIAYSGNVGATSGPHLHIALVDRLGGLSVPLRFEDFGGDGVPKYGSQARSGNFPVRFQQSYDAIQAALRARDLALAVDCPEIEARPLDAVAGITMPMPLRVLEEALAQRDEALHAHEAAAAVALREIGEAQTAAGDMKRAVLLAVLAQRDFPQTEQSAALRRALSTLEGDPRYHAVYESLSDEWTTRSRVVEAARAELAAKDAKSVFRLWRAAFDGAPQRVKRTVEAHLAVIESGLTQGRVEYLPPYEWQDVGRVITGNGAGRHADDGNRFAFDFAMPVGTPVVAAAEGVVIAVKDDTVGATGRDEDDNLVAVRHADGMVSVYRHLAFRSAAVATGQRVGRGDFLAYSGATGNVDPNVPHLHFGLQRGVDGPSVPVRFADFDGDGVPAQNDLVTSHNFPAKFAESTLVLRDAVRLYDLSTRFGCIEPGGARLAGVLDVAYGMPLRALSEPLRLRDAAWKDCEARAAAALAGARAETDFQRRVRLAALGADDFACTRQRSGFGALLEELRRDPRYVAAAASLETERDYRRAVEYAMRTEVEGREEPGAVLKKYRAALRTAPPDVRDALSRHIDALAAAGAPRPATASFVEGAISAPNDKILPRSSADLSVPRLTFWDHRGSVEWVQYEFGQERRFGRSAVYWFDDTGNGGCRVPRSWRLLWRDGEKWREVPHASRYGVARDRMNAVTFDPVTTTALRLEVTLQREFSGGLLEWTVGE